jgi:hypothetical protein
MAADLLVISPDHVEWVMNAPPTASPSTMMDLSADFIFVTSALVRDNPPRFLAPRLDMGKVSCPRVLVRISSSKLAADRVFEHAPHSLP